MFQFNIFPYDWTFDCTNFFFFVLSGGRLGRLKNTNSEFRNGHIVWVIHRVIQRYWTKFIVFELRSVVVYKRQYNPMIRSSVSLFQRFAFKELFVQTTNNKKDNGQYIYNALVYFIYLFFSIHL